MGEIDPISFKPFVLNDNEIQSIEKALNRKPPKTFAFNKSKYQGN